MKKKITRLYEDCLKQAFVLTNQKLKPSVTNIAQAIGVSKATVSKALKKMNEIGVIDKPKYDEVSLTKEGMNIAFEITRRYRIVLRFLIRNGVSPENARKEADQLEHILSEETIESLRRKCFDEFEERAKL